MIVKKNGRTIEVNNNTLYPHNALIDTEDLSVKFVKVGDEFRFTRHAHHIDMVLPIEFPDIDGAGFINICNGMWCYLDKGSMSINNKNKYCQTHVTKEVHKALEKFLEPLIYQAPFGEKIS